MTILFIAKEMGLCNRLRGLASILAFCTRAKKNLHVLWIQNHECPYEFEDMFDIPQNTTFIKESQKLDKYDLITEDMGHLCHLLPKQGLSYTLAPILISALMPNPNVLKIIQEKAREFNIEKCLGLHIRKTDHVQYANSIGQSTPLEEFYQTADQFSGPIFLACDDKEVQETFIMKYPERVRIYNKIENNTSFRQTDGVHAVVDIYLLSFCKFFKGSYASSFSAHVSYLMEAWVLKPILKKKFI